MDLIIKLTTELVVVIVAYLLARYIIPNVKNKIGKDGIANIISWASIFVNAAENIIPGASKGEDKYDYVIKALTEKLNEYGVKLNQEDIQAIIENAVYVMNKEKENK